MANVAALKKKAADFEAKKQFDKAIAAYREVLDAYDAGDDEAPDVALYNRVGDLLARQGNTPDAVTLYERAVDLYTEGGFFNNAIALCNKILRTSPGRASVYYKLGKISAAKGFKGEAKQNFLEYADRMQKSGQMTEAFRALKEFADLVPDQDDVRQMLADQLVKADKKTEALEQLQILYGKYDSEGRDAEAQATADRMKAIDPAAEPKALETTARAKGMPDDLIFIDLDAPVARRTRATRAVQKPVEEPVTEPKPVKSTAPAAAPVPPPAPPAAPEPPAQIAGLESTMVEPPSAPEPVASGSMLGLEPTALGGAEVPVEPEPMAASEFDEIDLGAIPEAPAAPVSGGDLALPGELPPIEAAASSTFDVIDIEPGVGGEAPPEPRVSGAKPAAGDLEMLDVEPTAIEEAPAAPDLEVIDLGTDDVAPPHAVEELAEVAPDTPTAFDEVPAETVEAPPPVRRTSSMLANSVMALRVRVTDEPENWGLRRQLAEALLDDGERDEGIRELETAVAGMEKANDLDGAMSVAEEIIRLNPASIRYHQKRVEYAFRLNDKGRLADAYLALADALFRDGQSERAKSVYHRVLELVPDDIRAKAAIESFGTPLATPAVAPADTGTKGKRYTAAMSSDQVPPLSPATVPDGGDDSFVSLGDWLRDQEGPKSTRMVTAEEEPTGDEQADFADMLKKFKQGVAENVEEEDHESHYDLGVAFKEMGLVDEAIAEFQKALRGAKNRARTYEALGQCFLEKKQLPVAMTILTRALNEPGAADEQLVGVLYLLGYVSEALAKHAEAKKFYERVFAVDIQFRDVGDRLNAVDKALS